MHIIDSKISGAGLIILIDRRIDFAPNGNSPFVQQTSIGRGIVISLLLPDVTISKCNTMMVTRSEADVFAGDDVAVAVVELGVVTVISPDRAMKDSPHGSGNCDKDIAWIKGVGNAAAIGLFVMPEGETDSP